MSRPADGEFAAREWMRLRLDQALRYAEKHLTRILEWQRQVEIAATASSTPFGPARKIASSSQTASCSQARVASGRFISAQIGLRHNFVQIDLRHGTSPDFSENFSIVKIVNLRYHQYQLAHTGLPMFAFRRYRDIEDTRMGQFLSRARPITLARQQLFFSTAQTPKINREARKVREENL